MSLRILFADDSMTAQSMGKKILSEAGYEVVAVSNGAAAVKKIAEQKPDIIILDVYMPGYSGLEVCEKVRGSMDTLKTPVLLTVGKMEPYRPEDGNRVRADGVIVKPFEASDLLAVVKKLEERVQRAPRAEQPVLVEPAGQNETTAEEAAVEIAEPAHFAPPTQSTVEVPDHMAGSAAFDDLLNPEPVSSAAPAVDSTPVVVEVASAPPPPVPERASVAEYEVPVSWRDQLEPEVQADAPRPPVAAREPEMRSVRFESAIAELEPTPPPPPPTPTIVQAAPAAAPPEKPSVLEAASSESQESAVTSPESASSASQNHSAFGGARPLHIPEYREPEPPASSYEFMPTSTPAPTEIEIPREPHLQETAEATTRSTVADVIEPRLMTTRQQFELERDHKAQVEAAELAPLESVELAPVEPEPPSAHVEDIPAEIVTHAPQAMPAGSSAESQNSTVAAPPPVLEISDGKISEDDFEARVAAAMAAYKSAGPDAPLGGYEELEPEAGRTEVFSAAPVLEAAPVESMSGIQEPQTISEAGAQAQEPIQPRAAAEAEHQVPTFEYQPPVSVPKPVQTFEPAPVPRELKPVDESTEIEMHPIDAGAVIDRATAPVESAVLAAAAAAGTVADHQAISQAVHRVMERLKPELVQEILRELKPKE